MSPFSAVYPRCKYLMNEPPIPALVFYEYAITVDLEGQQACTLGTWLHAITTSLLMVVMSAIAAVRTFALWNRDWRVLAVIMIPGLFPAFANLYFRSASAVLLVPSSLFACQTMPTGMSALAYKNLSVVARVVSIFGDGMVVVLTWLKTYRVSVVTKGVASRISVSTVILRDGTLYFIVICILNVVAIVYVVRTGSNLLRDIIVSLSSILMSRFLLNLRRHHARRAEWQFVTAAPEDGMLSYSFPRLTFPSNRSDSMGWSMIGDYGDPHDANDPDRDIELVEVPGKAPASDSGTYDPLASASAVAIATGPRSWKDQLYPGNKDMVEGAEPVGHRRARD
ncbi:hypothetical protein GSI_14438 [Ganoderma sinense ZZ0214-1]|uniref:Uncharacterized protein n=1 Tax=Ganoderma sinense ZZ0214-1 TaxID=1077348 RepID=A0A2G8RNP2_9APHY|nr:hypothetical protein GSI_14438 [Ganoderma sinense ZZ0214-1]